MAAREQGRYQAAVANRNADLANAQARDAMDRGRLDQTKLARQYSQLKGSQQASMAANGIDTSFGSAASVAADTAMLYGEDASTLSMNTVRETKGYEISAANYQSEGVAAKMKGKQAFTQSLFGAASTVLGAASQYSKSQAR